MKKIIVPLIIPFMLSLILHFILVAGVFRLGLIDFVLGLGDMPITARLISENTDRPIIRPKKVMGSSGIHARSVKVHQTVSAQAEAVAENYDSAPRRDEQLKDEPPQKNIPLPWDVLSGTRGTGANNMPQIGPAEKVAEPAPSPPPAEKPEVGADLLKNASEKLFFDIYWLGIYVGSAELYAVSAGGKVTIISRVHSAPFISAFYEVEDYAESTVVDGIPVRFRIKQHEGKFRSDKETLFDSDRRQIVFFNYMKGTRDDRAMNGNGGHLWDLISGFYYLRTQLIEVGKTVYIDVFDSGKVYTSEVSVIGKERIKLPETGEVDTVKVKPVLKSEGLFQNKGDIVIWLTDDDAKTPVKVETKTPIGKVVAVLKLMETQ